MCTVLIIGKKIFYSDLLRSNFDIVKTVNLIESEDFAKLALIKRPELYVTLTKLNAWKLTEFDKCVFLDADTLVLQNCDEIFEYNELSASPDPGWPDIFNSGVSVALYFFLYSFPSFCPQPG